MGFTFREHIKYAYGNLRFFPFLSILISHPLGYPSSYIAPQSLTLTTFDVICAFWKYGLKHGDPCSHTRQCVICSWPHFITPAKAITQSWWVKSASWAYMGGEEISAESLLKQGKSIFHEGNRIWGAFWMKKELHEANFRHRVWSGRVLRCAERIGSLGRGQRPDACS